jgi:tricorn protease
MINAGYYRHPTLSGDAIIFVCEDDLWSVPARGGVARRLTAGVGECTTPRLSPDGRLVGFIGREEGHPEVYVMPAEGGPAKRLTFMGAETCNVVGWSPDGNDILFVSDGHSPFLRHTEGFRVSRNGGAPRRLGIGHFLSIDIRDDGATALGRNNNDPARWKRYRGGTAGELWVDPNGAGTFRRLIRLAGNTVSPMWLAGRVFFLSDHEGVGNLYSCEPDGRALRRHTDHADYYVRFPSADAKRIVYGAGAELHVYDPGTDTSTHLEIACPSTSTHTARRFVDAAPHLEHFAPHPDGRSLALIARGQPFTMPLWEEAAVHHGVGSRVRYRNAEWLRDGARFAVVNDAAGAERIDILDENALPQRGMPDEKRGMPDFSPVNAIVDADLGRVVEMRASPAADVLAIANHRHELLLLDVGAKTARVIDRSPAARVRDLAWSPDGRWLAYSWAPQLDQAVIRVAEAESGRVQDVTSALRIDRAPAWDPEGKYLYFLSTRDFNPVYDALQFDLGFPYAVRPFLVTLRGDVASPFVPKPRAFNGVAKSKEDDFPSAATPPAGALAEHALPASPAAPAVPTVPDAVKPPLDIDIDFDGINGRIVGFPVEEGRYEQIAGAVGRALFTQFPVRGSLDQNIFKEEPRDDGTLIAYDFGEQRAAPIAHEVGAIRLAEDHHTLVYTSGHKLRVVDALEPLTDEFKPPLAADANRRTGWVDLGRVSVPVVPREEWAQMLDEAWRLQREQFWDSAMSRVDWEAVRVRYARLLPLVRTRSELSDLLWEMQGELGTSHAYEYFGDYRRPPQYKVGLLGADLEFDERSGGYRIARILRGDSWDHDADSPLAEPGLRVREGDVIVTVGGHAVARDLSPDELLVNAAGREVAIGIASERGERRRVVVKALRDERKLRYREWVDANRRLVRERTNGRVGYLHIPDMGAMGFAEFHRGYLAEFNRGGLIVDLRYNRGGHVSALLLEKLARRRVGYDVSRWGLPQPYPGESVAGPMVGITNQFAGSDGDIFSHCFKLYKLGPLVGKRTWGGVIGIWPQHPLVDGTVTTQPEFSFWFVDVGWSVENYGTDPDHEVDIAPHDYRDGRDPQMDKALELVEQALVENPLTLPTFDGRPNLSLPKLPPRK